MLKYEHLVGRTFAWGIRDCFSLARDFFKDNFDIDLPNYARPQDWSSDRLDLIGMLYEPAGFERITDWRLKDLRPADVLCVSVGESNPNHFSIYVGDNTIVHHLYGRLSTAEPLQSFWSHATAYILRHKDVPDLTPVLPDVTIESLLRERYRIKADSEV